MAQYVDERRALKTGAKYTESARFESLCGFAFGSEGFGSALRPVSLCSAGQHIVETIVGVAKYFCQEGLWKGRRQEVRKQLFPKWK